MKVPYHKCLLVPAFSVILSGCVAFSSYQHVNFKKSIDMDSITKGGVAFDANRSKSIQFDDEGQYQICENWYKGGLAWLWLIPLPLGVPREVCRTYTIEDKETISFFGKYKDIKSYCCGLCYTKAQVLGCGKVGHEMLHPYDQHVWDHLRLRDIDGERGDTKNLTVGPVHLDNQDCEQPKHREKDESDIRTEDANIAPNGNSLANPCEINLGDK